MSYVEQQFHLLSACHTGQEGSYLDFESKALHSELWINLAREVGDKLKLWRKQPKDGDAPLVEIKAG